MLDIHVPEPLEGRPSTKFEIPVVKAKDVAQIETSALPDDVYNEVMFLGLKALVNRGQSEVTGSTYPDDQERAEVAAEIAAKTIADMYAGKIRRSSGAKTTSAGRGEIQVEARRLAKIYVKAELKEAGLRVSLIKPVEITKLANEMIANDPSILEEARANVAKRGEKTKGKKIDIAALKAKVKEDPELVKKANEKGKGRKRPAKDEDEIDVAHIERQRPGFRPRA